MGHYTYVEIKATLQIDKMPKETFNTLKQLSSLDTAIKEIERITTNETDYHPFFDSPRAIQVLHGSNWGNQKKPFSTLPDTQT